MCLEYRVHVEILFDGYRLYYPPISDKGGMQNLILKKSTDRTAMFIPGEFFRGAVYSPSEIRPEPGAQLWSLDAADKLGHLCTIIEFSG